MTNPLELSKKSDEVPNQNGNFNNSKLRYNTKSNSMIIHFLKLITQHLRNNLLTPPTKLIGLIPIEFLMEKINKKRKQTREIPNDQKSQRQQNSIKITFNYVVGGRWLHVGRLSHRSNLLLGA